MFEESIVLILSSMTLMPCLMCILYNDLFIIQWNLSSRETSISTVSRSPYIMTCVSLIDDRLVSFTAGYSIICGRYDTIMRRCPWSESVLSLECPLKTGFTVHVTFSNRYTSFTMCQFVVKWSQDFSYCCHFLHWLSPFVWNVFRSLLMN